MKDKKFSHRVKMFSFSKELVEKPKIQISSIPLRAREIYKGDLYRPSLDIINNYKIAVLDPGYWRIRDGSECLMIIKHVNLLLKGRLREKIKCI